MRCPECATAGLPEDARFCGLCGASLHPPEEPRAEPLAPLRHDPATFHGDHGEDRPPDGSTLVQRARDAAPRWLATAVGLVLVVGLALVALRLGDDRSAPGLGALEGELWRVSLGTEPSFRFTNVDTGHGTIPETVAGDGDVYTAFGGVVVAHTADRAELRWRRVLPEPRSPTIAGPVLVLATDRGVVALDRMTGETRWEHPSTNAVMIATDGSDRVFVADPTSITALGTSDGRASWSLSAARGSDPDWLAASDGSLVTAWSRDGGPILRVFDSRTGTLRWERPATPPPAMHAVGDGNLYLADAGGAVAAYDLDDGEERWQVRPGREQAWLETARGVVVVWTPHGGVVGLSASDGRRLWRGPQRASRPPLVGDTTTYVTTTSPPRIVAVRTATGETRWSERRGTGSPVASDDDHLYLAQRRTVTAWRAEDGGERWHVSPTDPERPPGFPSPVVHHDRVYVTTVGGPLVALRRTSGRELWRFDPAAIEDELPTETPSGTTSVALPLQDRVIVASNRAVYALDASSAEVVASFPTNVAPDAVPVSADGHIIIDLGPSLVGLDAQTLQLRWQYTSPTHGARIGAHPVTPPTVHGDLVLVGGADGTLAALDPATGDPRWDLDLGSAIVSRPVVGDGLIVVRTETGDVRAFDADNGRALWRRELSPTGLGEPAVAGGTVYATDAEELIALDADTGTERWRRDLHAGTLSAPTALGDLVYVGTADGEVVAVSGLAGEVQWRFTAGAPVSAPPTVHDDDAVAVTDAGTVISLR